ncbi:MAG: 3-oxoacyl-[acyl-carrier-protein] synthase III C-terminal domain-containing protein [Candidatus Gastranaerophilaceae bacterium]
MSRIITVNTLLPEYSYTEQEAIDVYTKWVSSQSEDFRKKADRIFHHTQIKSKHTVAPPEVLLAQRTFEDTNNLYREKAIELGTEVLKQTLKKCGLKPEELDYLITTSCTGFMIPSVNAYIANNVGLRKDIKHLPITESGCAAGVTALIYANDLLKAYPDKKVAIITIELPSNTMQVNDFSWDNVVGTALFSDGVACVILDSKPELSYKIIDSKMYQVPNTTEILGYNLTNSGLKMNLNKCIPEVIQDNFYEMVVPFLEKNGLEIGDVDNFIIHPGGVKILDKIEELLSAHGKDAHLSREIMEKFGNMSSSTVLFILKEQMKNNYIGEKTLMLSFGPGFTANQVLLEWK